MSLRTATLLAGALLASCGEGARFRLEGSLTQLMDLGYDEVRLQPSVNDVALVFIRVTQGNLVTGPDGGTDGTRTEVRSFPLQVTFPTLADGGIPWDGRLDLAARDEQMNPVAVVTRNVANDPRNRFPFITIGTLFLQGRNERDAPISGDFHITFEPGREPASGRTVFGSFSGRTAP